MTKKQILEYHYKNTDECGMGCDADEWHHRCWRCGYIRDLEKCHIIPKSLGGNCNDPSNFVLLCNMCHQEAPNVNNNYEMWRFIEDTSIASYNCFWNYREILSKSLKKCSHHFGHGGKMNKTTKKWLADDILRQITPYAQFDKIIKSHNMGFDWDVYVSPKEKENFLKELSIIKND
jgi:hypothetical protein